MIQPTLEDFSEQDKKICQYQLGFSARLRTSKYYVVEKVKTTELPRYSDKYKPLATAQPTLRRADLHAPFFPPELLEAYLNPRKKTKGMSVSVSSGSLSYYTSAEEGSEQA